MKHKTQNRPEPSFTLLNTVPCLRLLSLLLALSAMFVANLALADAQGDYRSVASGTWNNIATWETNDGSSWVPATVTPTSAAGIGVVTIQTGTLVTNTSSLTMDQIVVQTGATLASSATLTVANGADAIDLDISGTFLALGGTSLSIAAGANVVVESGGVMIHNGTSTSAVTVNGTLEIAGGGKFQLQRAGGTIPLATWDVGSTCEVAYSTASTSKPTTQGQTFYNFTWNNPLQSGGTDLAGVLTSFNGDFLLAAANGQEVKWSGDASFGGNLTINDGSLNISGNSTPRTWSLKGDLTIGAGGTFNLSATANAQSVLILNGSGTQNYTCNGVNIATKLSWTVNSGSTLNLNNDLPMSASGRTLTANGTVNLNGKSLSTDLIAGTGTVRNQGGGNGLLAIGVANGVNTLDGTLTLVDGASGSLGLAKGGNSGTTGILTITAPFGYSGGLTVSNGLCYVNNTSGSGTGSGPVTLVNGTLGGTGIIGGSVAINGGSLAPGNSIGDLTINGSLSLNGNVKAEVDTTQSPDTDRVLGTTGVNYGGTLTILNNGPALTTSDTFQIFPAGTRSGTFTLSPATPDNDAGLAWDTSTLTSDGTLRIVTGVVASPILNVSQSGNILTFSWTGAYKLQSQTNSLNAGLQTDNASWFDYSDLSNPVDVTIDPANATVFFRLSE